MATQVTSTIYDLSVIDTRAAEVQREPYDTLPESITYKMHRMAIAVKNKTQFQVQISKSKNWSGKYGAGPSTIAPFSQMIYTTTNKDYVGWASGSTGFETFRIVVDGKTNWLFTFARCVRPFQDPQTCVVAGEDENKAWKDCVTVNTESKSNVYEGTDENGQTVSFYLHVSATPGYTAVINISQVVV